MFQHPVSLEDPSAVINLLLLPATINLTTHLALVAGLLAIAVLLMLSAAASASETGFFALSPAQLIEVRSWKGSTGRMVMSLLDDPKRLLATILLTNNFLNVGTVILSTYLVNRYLDFSGNPLLGLLFQVVFITSLLLLLAEILPKVFANHNPLKVVQVMALPMWVARRLMWPFSSALVNSTRFIDKRIEGKTANVSLDDISTAIDITADGRTDEADRKIMKSITRFGETTVREIMTPRVAVTAIQQSALFDKVIQMIVESGYSRIPVYEDSPDQVVGLLYIKDLLPYLNENPDFGWNKLVRKPFFVPENKPINKTLEEFQERKIHLAVVVDEYGGTSGIITLEDIVEEIVGEINDEFDTDGEGELVKPEADGSYLFDGRTPINDLSRALAIDDRLFSEAKGESETLAGLILELSGKFPSAGETIVFGNLSFRVEALDKRRIKKVRVTFEQQDNNQAQ